MSFCTTGSALDIVYLNISDLVFHERHKKNGTTSGQIGPQAPSGLPGFIYKEVDKTWQKMLLLFISRALSCVIYLKK